MSSTSRGGIGALLFASVCLLSVSGRTFPGSLPSLLPQFFRWGRDEGTGGDLIIASEKVERWKKIVSTCEGEDGGDDANCEVAVVNNTNRALVLCWVDHGGQLRHYTQVNDRSIRDGSVSHVHVEQTTAHHAFVCVDLTSAGTGGSSGRIPKTLAEVTVDQLVFVYTPVRPMLRHQVTVTQQRGSYHVDVRCTKLKRATVIDTSTKEYATTSIHGFNVRYEPGVFDSVRGLRETLETDLRQLQRLLPPAACRQLQQSTPLWLNQAITYGTTDAPVEGTSCCFHPQGGEEWLRRNGMRVDKVGGIEIYSAKYYLKCRGEWGDGGLLLHEYSHAYHNKCCPDGYDCAVIRDRYCAAMAQQLYDSVSVKVLHGGGGKVQKKKHKQKAYACANAMEFFAELSTAFLHRDDAAVDFNKWWPHNHSQLAAHDPATCAVLARVWGTASAITTDDLFSAQ